MPAPARPPKVEYEQQLVDYGDAGHRLRSDLSDHDVVEQAHEVCDNVLNENRQHDRKKLAVKSLISDESG